MQIKIVKYNKKQEVITYEDVSFLEVDRAGTMDFAPEWDKIKIIYKENDRNEKIEIKLNDILLLKMV